MNQPRSHRELSALVEELAELAKNAPGRLAERVGSLSIREQAELALRLPAPERLELLLHAPKPMRLVRALPDSEFYMTVRELGPADALPMVALSSAAQIHHLLDLESWRRDRFDADRSGAWIAFLLEAGEPTIRRFLRTADDELLSLLFQRWIRIREIESEDGHASPGPGPTETGDERGFVSPDGQYLLRPTIAEHAPAVQRLTQLFYRDEPQRYQQVLWAAAMQMPSELEEQALHWRQSRLEEHGFPPWEDAISIYAPPAGLVDHPRPPEPSDPDGLAAPRSPLGLLAATDRLARAVEGLSAEKQDHVLHEMVSLGNRLLVADGVDTGDPAYHRAALKTAAGYVAIAVEARGGDRAGVAQLLEELPLIELFREGYARAVELQTRARALTKEGWPAAHPRALELLDSPIRERVTSLLELRPLYFEVGNEEQPGGPRPFRLPQELEETRVALEMAELVGGLMVGRLKLDVARATALDGVPLRFSGYMLTTLAWHATRSTLRTAPLPADAVSDFLRNVASRRTAPPEAPARALDALTGELVETFDLSAREVALWQAFGRAALERLNSECAALDPGVPVDSRFISCLLVE